MANQRVPECFVESTLVQQPLSTNRIDVEEAALPDASGLLFDGNNAGGGVYFDGQDGNGLIWSTDAEVQASRKVISSDDGIWMFDSTF